MPKKKTKTKTGFICKECRQPTTPDQVLAPPVLKGSHYVTCRTCAKRPVCSLCMEPGTTDKNAPEMQIDHPQFGDVVFLVSASMGDENDLACRGCIQDLQKAGIEITEDN
jgi:hypothetical protein